MSTSRAVTPRWRIRARALVARPAGGAEAGHGEGADAVARHAERVHRLAGDQQGQRRVEAAGDADGDRRLADVLEPLGQAGHLGPEDLLAALAQLLLARAGRTGGRRRRGAGRPARLAAVQRERHAREVAAGADVQRGVAEAVGADAVGAQAVEVDVGDQQRVVALEALRLGQQRAVLGDEAVAAEDDVGGRFPDAAGGVDVGGDAAAGLVDDELPAVGGLADDLVAGRQVDAAPSPRPAPGTSWAAPAPTGPRRSRRRRSGPPRRSASKRRSVPNGTRVAAER